MFSFVLSFVIFRVLVADFEHVFACQKRYRITIAFLESLKYLTQQTNTQSQQQTP